MKAKICLSIIICCLLSIKLYSQKKEFKFGKIDQSDLTTTRCPIDSNADAYVIGQYGTTSFEYVDSKNNFQTIFEYHARIKILQKTALHWANVMIPLYRIISRDLEERVSELKGNTYNIEDGKVIISKLDKSATFKEEVNKGRSNLRFTMPNVKEGSVLEISYKIYSEFWYVRDWDFQMSIPVLISQYEVRIPEYFNYKVFQNGYEPIRASTKSEHSSFTYTYYQEDNMGMRVANSRRTVNTDFTTNITTYSGENIKAFHDESFMSSKKNYLSSIEYELQSIHYPYSTVKNFTTDWASITKQLWNSDNFGGILNKQGATNYIVQVSTQGINLPIDKARAIYEYIRDNFKCDGHNSIFASNGIRKTIENKAGNSADINLLLVTALKNAGVKAEAVVLSTRDNGIILMSYPVLQKLNYVIASFEIDGKRYLLDATDKNSPFGFMPEKCLNGQGRIISEEAPGVVDLTSNQNYFQNISISLTINNKGELSGQWNELRKGYAAHNFRDDIANSKSKDDYIQEKQKKHAGLSINHYRFGNLDSLNKDVNISYDISLTGHAESTGNLLMIHPLLLDQLHENPFKLEERKFPIDYSYNYNKTFIAQYEVPPGYQVETLPKPVSMILPDKNAVFTYNIAVNGTKIQVMRKLSINKVIFLPDEYKALKEFYNQMVAKEAEVIVLKKI